MNKQPTNPSPRRQLEQFIRDWQQKGPTNPIRRDGSHVMVSSGGPLSKKLIPSRAKK